MVADQWSLTNMLRGSSQATEGLASGDEKVESESASSSFPFRLRHKSARHEARKLETIPTRQYGWLRAVR